MDNKNKVSFGAILAISATWFSIHAGGGFASGSQTMGFLTRFGYNAISVYPQFFAPIRISIRCCSTVL